MIGPFPRIGLFAKHNSESVRPTLEKLIRFLTNRGHSLKLDRASSALIAPTAITVVDRDILAKDCDLIMVVGGDGSFLNAARAIVSHQVPILGINRGKLGFLVDILPHELETELGKILAGDYIEEDRFLLTTVVKRNHQIVFEAKALNDIVLYSSHNGRMIDFEVYINDRFVLRQQADGMITATPTGSTAYALSAGGSILYPTLKAISLTPLYPHTLSSRPIVVSYKTRIKLIVADAVIGAKLNCDGQVQFDLTPNDEIHIEKFETHLTLIHPKQHEYFSVLREKLGWNTSQLKDL